MNATRSSLDSRLIIVSLRVAGARRSLRALLDSGASNNFFRATCLPELPTSTKVKSNSTPMAVKLADGKPRGVLRCSVTLSYDFSGFQSRDEFLVIDLNASFNCTLGMPWCMRHEPNVN